ncbi:hypothetical protein MBM_08767 [Drepanopeziza brunnea f. sp. 'multigermtubi' MB_m1]|uniref:Uncharacterized protein n=1 Tax=Marssonina brunnea f. sp. multigermtubi (strain MB_m1) TaxID=1072389 RepID=K1W7F3_MARBU|nr:uncharacterized protein MBM_08767 [Drepanopeziza brunnea f. sp. 'multigermtubi' MB_m1]EKD13005.1 hypothetical protein MBM_08767 [Drepanopeziza brunnea f. sp. 'multigermtubi' MB_m1]
MWIEVGISCIESGHSTSAEVERKALQRTVRSQKAQLSALQTAQAQLEIKDQIIKSQAELIERITTASQILPAPVSSLTPNSIAQPENISAAHCATQQTAIDARGIQQMEAYIAELEHKLKDIIKSDSGVGSAFEKKISFVEVVQARGSRLIPPVTAPRITQTPSPTLAFFTTARLFRSSSHLVPIAGLTTSNHSASHGDETRKNKEKDKEREARP